MERIRLTRDEKAVLRMIQGKRVCPDCYDRSLFNRCADSLERKGLVRCAVGGRVQAYRRQDLGYRIGVYGR